MKNVRILALIACMGTMVFLPSAQAAFLSVSPTGQFDASAVTSVTYDVFFNVDAAESFTGDNRIQGIDLGFVYDASEIDNPVNSNLISALATIDAGPSIGTLNYLFLSFSDTFDLSLVAGSSNRLGTLTFDILNPAQVFDGLADFSVLSQIGTGRGFLLATGSTLEFGGADGADVGVNPVPVPGAVWLLGSGLLGLVGIRRRRGV